jgi:peptidoglycan biosynthesis protein MviN/MurJ (putative lipid II flippase)
MKTINVCQRRAIEERERRAEFKREVIGTLQGIGVLVFILLILGIEDWVEYIV